MHLIKKSDLEKFLWFIGKKGTEVEIPLVKDLFGFLVEERCSRFVSYLSSSDPSRKLDASEFLRKTLRKPSGFRVVQHIIRECFFGLEEISLSALAVLASITERDENLLEHSRIAASLEGLHDITSISFLGLLSNHEHCYRLQGAWLPAFIFDCLKIDNRDWERYRTLAGLTVEQMYCSITEIVEKRILLPDASTGRLRSLWRRGSFQYLKTRSSIMN